MKKAIGNLILCRIMGYKVIGDLPDLKKIVAIGGPHTSNWDFIIAISVIWIRKMKITVLAKKELFRFPFGWFFRSLGVIPVERKKNQRQVDAIADMLNNSDEMRIALAPEGTRKKVEKMKTGFYYIAQKANVPLVMALIDAPNKIVRITEPYYLTGDMEVDLDFIYKAFRNVTGVIPENSF